MELPVIVVGAGPQGLAAAAHLLERGIEPLVLEHGAEAAAAVAEWGHVRLFSAWPELVDEAAARLLAGTGWERPTTGYPTGAEWRERYLVPLATVLGEHVRLGTEVTGISRLGRDRLVSAGRDEQPFVVHADGPMGAERIRARAVIDASGTWSRPNPAGADGLPALGEREVGDLVVRTVPSATHPEAYAGKSVVVIGAGDSALGAIGELFRIAAEHPGTAITWAIRRGTPAKAYGGGASDQLEQRGALGVRARRAVESGVVEVVTGFRTDAMRRVGDRLAIEAEDGRRLIADRAVVLTGFRPDLSFLSELRLDLDPVLECPRPLAAEIDPNVHSCGSVGATGAADLRQPEARLYLVGMKSYGRAPTFLALTGYEQVRSVVAEISGDHEAAARVELALPDTGVCGGSGLYDDPVGESAGGCGSAEPAVVGLGGVEQLVGTAPLSLAIADQAAAAATSVGCCGPTLEPELIAAVAENGGCGC